MNNKGFQAINDGILHGTIFASPDWTNPQFIPSPRLTIATAAMQALIERVPNQSPKHIAMRAVAYADALLDELSRTKDDGKDQ